MHTVYLALGSNVGDKEAFIKDAVVLLSEKITIEKQAPIYTSRAFGFTEQDDFLNTALVGKTDLEPRELLSFVKEIEKQIGRIERFHWGPREIDIDIIFYDEIAYKDETLEIPHARTVERDFVLIPLLAINPDLVHPITRIPLKESLDALPAKDRSVL